MLTVYRGADGAFTLYDDDGETTGYANGAFSRIPIRYDDATGAVTLGAREGGYPGMADTRLFNIRWISGRDRNAVNFEAPTPRTVRYTGAEVTVQAPG
jgi:alpha-D-xyloside xylohydrolase